MVALPRHARPAPDGAETSGGRSRRPGSRTSTSGTARRPMLRLLYWLALVPYYVVTGLRLERYFVNTVAGMGGGGLAGQAHWKYMSVSARKPGGELVVESAKTK